MIMILKILQFILISGNTNNKKWKNHPNSKLLLSEQLEHQEGDQLLKNINILSITEKL